DLVEHADPRAVAVLDEAAHHLGLAIANHLNSSDPGNALVLFANKRLEALMTEPLGQTLVANTFPGLLENTNVVFDVADEQWRWKGTAALALEKVYLA